MIAWLRRFLGLNLPNRSDEYSEVIANAERGWMAPRSGGYTGGPSTEPGQPPVGPATTSGPDLAFNELRALEDD